MRTAPIPIILFLLSIGIQSAAAIYALLLIRLTGRKLAWILISIALALMTWRRVVAFISILTSGKQISFDMSELIALMTSFLMLLGVLRIGDYFRSINLADTVRKQAEEALHESETLFKNAFASSPIGMALVAPDGRWLKVNPALCQIVGYSAEELLTKTFQDITHMDDLTADLAYVRQMLAGEIPTYQMEKRYLHKQGQVVWILLSVSLVRDNAGQPLFFISQILDITERKQAEERTYRHLQKLSALRSIDLTISSSLDLRVTLKVFIEHVITQMGVDAANVLLLNPHTGMLEYAASQGFRTSALRHSHLRLGEGYAGVAALENRIVSVPDLKAEDSGFSRLKLLEGEDFITYYGVPLLAKGHVKGVLEIFHRNSLEPDEEWFNFLDALALQAAIAIDNNSLFYELERSNMDLMLAYDRTIEGWSRALDYRDKETEGHSRRVTELTINIARELGMNEEELVHVRRGALLHDIGKMGIPDSILLKPGSLTEEEWKIMRLHPVYSYELLHPIDYLRASLDIPYCHHENWDGSGYPRGLKGEQIPLSARIFAIVDVWDALRSERPYRQAWSKEKTKEYILSLSAIQFDPKVVEAFIRAIAEKKA